MPNSKKKVVISDYVTAAGDCEAVSQAFENTKKNVTEAVSMITKFQEMMDSRIARLEKRECSCNSELQELISDIE